MVLMGRLGAVVACCLLWACAGERSISTRVRLSETANRVSGLLVDGEGRALTAGAVFLDDGQGGPVTDGGFVFDDLPPGDYVVKAWNYDSSLSGRLALSLEPGEQLDGMVIDVTQREDLLAATAEEEREPPVENEPPSESEPVATRTVRVVNLDADLRGLLIRHADASMSMDDLETSVCPEVHGDLLFDCVVVRRDDDVAYVRYLHGAPIRGVLRGAPKSARVSCDRYEALVSEHGQFAINCPEHVPLLINDEVSVSLPTRVGKELFVEIELR
jgi:hypothetical protein